MVNQGDIILLNFTPQSGHEQKGIRPALVISNKIFNDLTKFAIVCPITQTNRKYLTHIELDERTKTKGVVMCDQLKSLDIKKRDYKLLEKIPTDILFEVLDLTQSFFDE